MTKDIHLSDYATAPLYNIKAVVQATQISPSTLRAWERRYNMCQPQRSESGYRLYSERDIAVIRWLRAQVDAGMSISQAVAWFDTIASGTGGTENAVLPGTARATSNSDNAVDAKRRATVRDFDALQHNLLDALLDYNESRAEEVVAEAFAMYTVEQVGESLFMPVLVEIGERWHSGSLSVTVEHFATNYLLQRLAALLRAISIPGSGPLIWVGCAPGELHEVGALLLSVYLRRLGYRVSYLGQDLPIDGIADEVNKQKPAILLLSASTINAAQELTKLTSALSQTNGTGLMIGYGGQVFSRYPELRDNVAGKYLGSSAKKAVEHINNLLVNGANKD